jgi:hypothetical protein
MLYLKAAAVGTATGLIAGIAWGVAAIAVPIYTQMLLSSLRNEGGGIGAAAVDSGSILLAAVIGFGAGFYWTIRRARRRRLSN